VLANLHCKFLEEKHRTAKKKKNYPSIPGCARLRGVHKPRLEATALLENVRGSSSGDNARRENISELDERRAMNLCPWVPDPRRAQFINGPPPCIVFLWTNISETSTSRFGVWACWPCKSYVPQYVDQLYQFSGPLALWIWEVVFFIGLKHGDSERIAALASAVAPSQGAVTVGYPPSKEFYSLQARPFHGGIQATLCASLPRSGALGGRAAAKCLSGQAPR